jgi:hypothetical protein
MALLALTGLAVAPQASADDMAELKARIANLEKQEAERESMGGGNMVSFRGVCVIKFFIFKHDFTQHFDTILNTE